jgi:uncharacterized LabA/DUF88 family protein
LKTASFLVDGFNLYHSLKESQKPGQSTKWLDIPKLCNSLLPNLNSQLKGREDKLRLGRVIYFSAYAEHLLNRDPDLVNRHKAFVSALQSNDVTVILGKFKKKTITCKVDKSHNFTAYEEKQTDVSIGIHLVKIAFQKETDIICVVTGDTDIIPAILMAKEVNPNVLVAVIFPANRYSEELKNTCDFHIQLNAKSYNKFQFPEIIKNSKTGETIQKPSDW